MNLSELEKNKTFCVYPWIHQMTTPTGKVNFCCVSEKTYVTKEDGSAYVLDQDDFSDAWNSQYMKEIRRRMLHGEKVKGCEVCYQQEGVGKESYRIRSNQEWRDKIGDEAVQRRIEQSQKRDFSVEEAPSYLDLRLGNLCNLKCRMCNPYNSIQIYKEWMDLDAASDQQYSAFWQKYGYDLGGSSEWVESEIFWENVEKYIPHLKKVYMTGGEPTLIKGNSRFLKKCIELGYADQIELFFNMNFTNLKDDFIDLINQFKWTSINASFDGYGELNRYIRYPSQWSTCETNFRKLAEQGWGNIGLGISPVVQVYNILDLDKVLDFAETIMREYDRPVIVDFLFCFSPTFLDVIHLPKSIKQLAISRLQAFRERTRLNLESSENYAKFIANSIDSLTNRLQQNMDRVDENLIRDFFHYTKTLDEKRKQSFQEYCPELYDLFLTEGYHG